MTYFVSIKKKLDKKLNKFPLEVRQLFFLLLEDLKELGPIQKGWENFSSLGGDKYHCHLNYRYVACWTWKKKQLKMEVYYVGSREKAPY